MGHQNKLPPTPGREQLDGQAVSYRVVCGCWRKQAHKTIPALSTYPDNRLESSKQGIYGRPPGLPGYRLLSVCFRLTKQKPTEYQSVGLSANQELPVITLIKNKLQNAQSRSGTPEEDS